jgi:hypothetical protein
MQARKLQKQEGRKNLLEGFANKASETETKKPELSPAFLFL